MGRRGTAAPPAPVGQNTGSTRPSGGTATAAPHPVRLATAGRTPTQPYASCHRGYSTRPTSGTPPRCRRSTWKISGGRGGWTDRRTSAMAMEERRGVESGSSPRLAQPCVRRGVSAGATQRAGGSNAPRARMHALAVGVTSVAHASHPLRCPLRVPPTDETQPCAREGLVQATTRREGRVCGG